MKFGVPGRNPDAVPLLCSVKNDGRFRELHRNTNGLGTSVAVLIHTLFCCRYS